MIRRRKEKVVRKYETPYGHEDFFLTLSEVDLYKTKKSVFFFSSENKKFDI